MSSLGLDGLISGMPTTEVVEQLLEIEKLPIYRYEEDINNISNIKDAWRDINSRMSNLEGKLADLKLSATFNSRIALSGDETIVTASAANSVTEGVYELAITHIAEAHRIASDEQADSTSELGLSGTIEINGQQITIEGTFSLSDIRDTINNTEEIGVSASIINNTLVLEADETGVANQLTLNDPDDLLENLGFLNADSSLKNELQEARDALLTINGIEVISASNTVDQAVEGVTFNIRSSGNTTVEVSRDTEKAEEAVQAFVDQYNSLMSFIDSKTYYSTDDDSSGVLQGDSTIRRLQFRIREMVTDKVETGGDITSFYQLGISIDEDGVMSFDSSELIEALEDKPETVISFFNGENDEDGFDGMAVRLDSYLDKLLKSGDGLIPVRLEFFDDRIDSLNDRIVEAERRVEMSRERYIAQFSAMEKALGGMQQQQSWMMSQLSTLGSGLFSSL